MSALGVERNLAGAASDTRIPRTPGSPRIEIVALRPSSKAAWTATREIGRQSQETS